MCKNCSYKIQDISLQVLFFMKCALLNLIGTTQVVESSSSKSLQSNLFPLQQQFCSVILFGNCYNSREVAEVYKRSLLFAWVLGTLKAKFEHVITEHRISIGVCSVSTAQHKSVYVFDVSVGKSMLLVRYLSGF